MDKKLYTLLVYSENIAGVLNQVTAVFTRRQVNIESINASASGIENVHKYTITAWSDEEQIDKITKQIEKKIDVIKADYYLDDQLFIHEVALFKVDTQMMIDDEEITRSIRHSGARILEVTPQCSTVLLSGVPADIARLHDLFEGYGCLKQYTRSGRIAVMRDEDDFFKGDKWTKQQ